VSGEAVRAQSSDGVVLMVETVLEEFETTNGPIVEVQGRLLCAESQETDAAVCPEPRADSLLAEYAEQVGAEVVLDDSALPACRWYEVEVRDPKGVRMFVHMGGDPEGVTWMTVSVRCAQDPGRAGREFLHAVRYPFELIDGEWQRSGEAITVIS